MSTEIREVSESVTHLESLSNRASRRLAGRISRRSFMGRVGKGAIAATLGSAGANLLLAPAIAHDNPCQAGCSIGCATLTGSNNCPSGSCNCGCWCIRVPSGTCSSTYREWCDCCGGCQGNLKCVEGSDGLTHPSCYNHKAWPEGCDDLHIKCRRHRCVSLSDCERVNTVCAN